MIRWGIATTALAPLPEVQAFVAHHLELGAAQITVHFDHPDDPAAAALTGVDRVTVIVCDDCYWADQGQSRPLTIEGRQTVNIKRAYEQSDLDWIAHIDIDEFIWPQRAIDLILSDVPATEILTRMQPWEALHTPGLPDDILTARWFRKPIKPKRTPVLHQEAFSPFRDCFDQGVLSHAVGKCFFRTGVTGLVPRLHGGDLQGERLVVPDFAPDLPLLHFHAQDPDRWLAALPARLTDGAYRFNAPLVDLLQGVDPSDARLFYDRVMSPSPERLKIWQGRGAVLAADLRLRAKVAARFGPLG